LLKQHLNIILVKYNYFKIFKIEIPQSNGVLSSMYPAKGVSSIVGSCFGSFHKSEFFFRSIISEVLV
jgi:hypothetical protein